MVRHFRVRRCPIEPVFCTNLVCETANEPNGGAILDPGNRKLTLCMFVECPRSWVFCGQFLHFADGLPGGHGHVGLLRFKEAGGEEQEQGCECGMEALDAHGGKLHLYPLF